MSNYLKQKDARKKREPKKQADAKPMKVIVTGPDDPLARVPSLQHDVNYVAGLGGIEQSLDWIARGISQLTNDEHSVGLSVSTGSASEPIKLTLHSNDYDDTMERFVSAVERIADSVAKLAGFSRPRLEHWYDQDEYTPRYRDSSANGGAPGPAPQKKE